MCVVNLPHDWSEQQFKDYISGLGLRHSGARKSRRNFRGYLTLPTMADRKAAEEILTGKVIQGNGRPLIVEDAKPRGQGPKHKGGQAAEPTVPVQERDIRDTVSPLWRMSYPEQLVHKRAKVEKALREITKGVRESAKGESQPAWLLEAADRSGYACTLEGIVRSPQLYGYRNKTEFSIGYGFDGRPAIGFLLGSFRDGLSAVVSADDCPHISQVAKRLAALVTEFLRTKATLPVWDKRVHEGFWRLLVVREGRQVTPLPTPRTDATERLLGHVPFGSLPWSDWLVGGDPKQSPVAAALGTEEEATVRGLGTVGLLTNPFFAHCILCVSPTDAAE